MANFRLRQKKKVNENQMAPQKGSPRTVVGGDGQNLTKISIQGKREKNKIQAGGCEPLLLQGATAFATQKDARGGRHFRETLGKTSCRKQLANRQILRRLLVKRTLLNKSKKKKRSPLKKMIEPHTRVKGPTKTPSMGRVVLSLQRKKIPSQTAREDALSSFPERKKGGESPR